ncbi:hypothetical protein B0H66DRAFT_537713 [Apodospora peruviana]|uniref:Uncharacterized protein n=1 Tax=Apodospora peruviana TaxID=516989 RepID=A0AAE0HTI1_9PEZI|nr:hypothetical protein B0H66DRAFT_537713 [Apodospora peruviana]
MGGTGSAREESTKDFGRMAEEPEFLATHGRDIIIYVGAGSAMVSSGGGGRYDKYMDPYYDEPPRPRRDRSRARAPSVGPSTGGRIVLGGSGYDRDRDRDRGFGADVALFGRTSGGGGGGGGGGGPRFPPGPGGGGGGFPPGGGDGGGGCKSLQSRSLGLPSESQMMAQTARYHIKTNGLVGMHQLPSSVRIRRRDGGVTEDELDFTMCYDTGSTMQVITRRMWDVINASNGYNDADCLSGTEIHFGIIWMQTKDNDRLIGAKNRGAAAAAILRWGSSGSIPGRGYEDSSSSRS